MNPIIQSEDTIAAIATAISFGKGGIAIIRISGIDAIRSCKKIVITKSKKAWDTHRVFNAFIKDPESNLLIDQILVLVMKSPHSFTGEDIVELHCHGGIIVVNRILEILLRINEIRLANPGEFSQRAFLNGKIDLTQAESINQIIKSKNIRAAELAFKGIQGEIKNKISCLKRELIDQLAEIEARVDFEEDFKDFDYMEFEVNLKSITNKIETLIENSKRNSYLNDGISIALIGKTNTGKSSLLNLLSRQNKAIVTKIPGTTRDIIEVNLLIKNIPIKLIDTAGIRQTNDLIENIGIKKSLEIINKADYIIYIYDLSKGLDEEDSDIIREIPKNKLITIVGNKEDLINTNFVIKNKYFKNTILMSAKNKSGENYLIEKITQKCGAQDSSNMDIFLNDRQIYNLRNCLMNLNDISKIIDNKLPFDLISIELRESIKNISKLTGEELTEELLDSIFSKFCIGK